MRIQTVSLFLIFLVILSATSCDRKNTSTDIAGKFQDSIEIDSVEAVVIVPIEVIIEKELLYDQYTLEDTYDYQDTTRTFQWEKIRQGLVLLDSIQQVRTTWAILQNYKNKNGEAPLVRNYRRNEYKRVSDSLGVERYQSVPLFLPGDSIAERYGRDGFLVEFLKDTADFVKVKTIYFDGEWIVPERYVKIIGDTIVFNHAIFIDRAHQNIATLEKVEDKWLVRSMNPSTTGVHRPPYAQETPLGMFVLQEKKVKMIFLKDGSQETGGYAPYASRFTNGAYIHGVPVNVPQTGMIEYSRTLGTTPRSHMCVRNATSHSRFIYDWAPTEQSIVFIIE